MLTEIRVPLHDDAGSAYEKVERRVGDWAVAAAGAALTISDGVIDARRRRARRSRRRDGGHRGRARAPRPPALECRCSQHAAAIAAESCTPVSDQRGSKDYKRHVAGVLTERALSRAAERAAMNEEV